MHRIANCVIQSGAIKCFSVYKVPYLFGEREVFVTLDKMLIENSTVHLVI